MDAPIPVKATPQQKKKPAWLGFLHGLRKKPVVAPVESVPVVEVAPVPETEPKVDPAPAPKRPIDELLGVFSK